MDIYLKLATRSDIKYLVYIPKIQAKIFGMSRNALEHTISQKLTQTYSLLKPFCL